MIHPSRALRRACCLAIAPLLAAPAFAQTTATWLAPVSGTWSDPANWSTNPAFPNDPATDALFSATGVPYTVTLNSAASIGSLTGTSPDASLNVAAGGTLTLAGTLDLGPGSLSLSGAGKVVGGTVASNVTSTFGSLDSVSLAAELTVAGVTGVTGSFSLTGGSIRFTKPAALTVAGNALTGTGSVVFDNPTGSAFARGPSPATSFTVGPNITVRTGPSSSASLGYLGNQNLPLVNQGTISAQTSGSTLTLFANGLTNTGTIESTNNATLRIWGGYSGTILTPAALSTINTSDGGVAYAMVTNIFNPSTYTLSAAHAVGLGLDANFHGGTIASADGTPLTIYSYTPSPNPGNPNPTPTGTATLTGVIASAPVSIRPGATLLANGGTLSGAITSTGGTLTLSGTWSLPGSASLTAGSTLNLNTAPTGAIGPISLTDSTANIKVPLTAAQTAAFTTVNNSTVNVSAPINNTGNTFPLPAGSTLKLISAGTFGSITGGTIGTPGTPGGTVDFGDFSNSYLTDVTVAANIAVGVSSFAQLKGTCTLVDSHVSIVGDANSSSRGELLAESLAGTGDISFDGAGTFSGDIFPSFTSQTIPAGVTVRTGSQSGSVFTYEVAGTLAAETPGRRLALSTYGPVTGTLQAKNASTLAVWGYSAILTGPENARTLTGGTWIADGGTIDLAYNIYAPVPVITNAATITLSGPASSFAALDTLATNAGSLTFTDGRSFTTQSDFTNTGTLTLGPAAAFKVSGALSNPGTISLTSATSALLVDYTGPSPIDSLRDDLLSGRLTTSLPGAAIAYVEASQLDVTTHAGLAVDATTLLTVVTVPGDANLDGRVDPDDYALLDRALAQFLTSAHWTDGDFNYDGQITSADYLLIDTTLGQAQGFSPGFLSLRESQFGADYVSQLLVGVPEPAFLPLLFAALPLARRRR